MSHTDLRRLLDIMSDAVGRLEGRYASVGLDVPSLDNPMDPTNPNEALATDPEVLRNSMLIVAASHQISASIRLPASNLWDMAMGYHISSALQAATRGNIPEILREGGPAGVHITEIAAKNGMNAEKASRILRLLATHHVFREVEPDVWTNNRLSSVLDTLKPTAEIFSSPTKKYLGTSGVSALVETTTDELLKGGAIFPDLLVNPETSHSEDPAESAVMQAFKSGTTYFQWLNTPGQEFRSSRFNIAMEGVTDGEAVLRGFPWTSLPVGARILDVGGGLGSVSLTLAKHFPHLKFIIQDLPGITEQSADFWNTNLPEAQRSGRVVFQAHDFFTPQPANNADLFLLRMIIHDWATSYAIKILKHLRAVAMPGKTKLLLIEQITAYACPDNSDASSISGATLPLAPQPLLPNFGKANSLAYLSDIQMLIALQGEERTLGQHVHVTSEAGWKIVRVYHPTGSLHCHIVAEAVDFITTSN